MAPANDTLTDALMPLSSRTMRPRPSLVAMAALAIAATPSLAHDLGTTETLITLGEQRFEIVMECDLDALALGAAPTADDAELLAALEAMDGARLAETITDLRQLFARRVRLFAGDARIDFEVEFPDREAGHTLGMTPPTFLGLSARLRGALPSSYETLRFRLSRAFPSAQLTVIDANGEILLEEFVPRGEDSSYFTVGAGSAPERGQRKRATGFGYLLLAVALIAAAGTMAWRRASLHA